MMVFRMRDISFTCRRRSSQPSAPATPPQRQKPPWLAHPNLVSDVIPKLHQDLVEEGELGDQGLGLFPCQGSEDGETQQRGVTLGPLCPQVHTTPLNPTRDRTALASVTSSWLTHLKWTAAHWSLEEK